MANPMLSVMPDNQSSIMASGQPSEKRNRCQDECGAGELPAPQSQRYPAAQR